MYRSLASRYELSVHKRGHDSFRHVHQIFYLINNIRYQITLFHQPFSMINKGILNGSPNSECQVTNDSLSLEFFVL